MPLMAADVADADLVLEDQEEPADDVADQRLRAEADRQAGDAGAGQHRRDVHARTASSTISTATPTDRRWS